MKMNIKTAIFLAIISFIICIAIFYVPWIHRINKTMPGIKYRVGDSDYTETLNFKIDGIYLDYFVKEDRFEGKIMIDKYDYTKVAFPQKVLFPGRSGNLYYNFIPKNGQLDGNFLGNLYCTPNFSKLTILVFEKIDNNSSSPNSKHPLLISAPADNRDEAMETSRELTYQDDFLGNTDWN